MEMQRVLEELRNDIRELVKRTGEPGLPLVMTRVEAAKVLRISLSTLKVWLEDGRIISCEDPRCIPRSEVLRLAGPKPAGPGERRRSPAKSPSRASGKEAADKIRAALRKSRPKG